MRAAMGDESSSDDSSSDPALLAGHPDRRHGEPRTALTGQTATTGATTSAASLATPSGGASSPAPRPVGHGLGPVAAAAPRPPPAPPLSRALPPGAGRAGLGQLDRAHQSADHVVVGAELRYNAGSAGERRRRELIRLSSAGTANAGSPPAHMIVAASRWSCRAAGPSAGHVVVVDGVRRKAQPRPHQQHRRHARRQTCRLTPRTERGAAADHPQQRRPHEQRRRPDTPRARPRGRCRWPRPGRTPRAHGSRAAPLRTRSPSRPGWSATPAAAECSQPASVRRPPRPSAKKASRIGAPAASSGATTTHITMCSSMCADSRTSAWAPIPE